MRKLVMIALFLNALVSAGGFFQEPTADAQEAKPKVGGTRERTFENATGWQWRIVPDRSSSASTRSIVMIRDEDKEGALLVTVAWNQDAVGAVEFFGVRPVAFDEARNRYPLKHRAGGEEVGVSLMVFCSDPKTLPSTKVAYVGVEILTPEGKRIASQEAARQAKEAGVEVLPLPVVGEPYEFVLTDSGRKQISSRHFQHKVVLIDCWATWCTPCMAKMPKLKDLYDKWHKDGLEVVGVNFDGDAEKAKKAAASLELKWPLVLVPGDKKTRELWNDVAGIRMLPRLLVIGRDGRLRADCSSDKMEQTIEAALRERLTR